MCPSPPDPYLCPDLACQCKCCELIVVDAVIAEVADVDLDTGMVLGSDQLVGPSTAYQTNTDTIFFAIIAEQTRACLGFDTVCI